MSCVLFAQRTVDNLSLVNAALDKYCGGNGEIHVSTPWLPPEAIQAVPAATASGVQPFMWDVLGKKESLKRDFLCVCGLGRGLALSSNKSSSRTFFRM